MLGVQNSYNGLQILENADRAMPVSAIPEDLTLRVKKAAQNWALATRAAIGNLNTRLIQRELGILKSLSPVEIFQRILETKENGFSAAEASLFLTSTYGHHMENAGFSDRDIALYRAAHRARTSAELILETCTNIIGEVQNELLDVQDVSQVGHFDQLWCKHGYPVSLLEAHPDFVKFLKDSRLFFPIHGYKTSAGMDGIQVDQDGNPHLLMEGAFVPWEKVKKRVVFDPSVDQIVSCKKAENGDLIPYPTEPWTYFGKEGLCMRSGNLEAQNLIQAYKLTAEELKSVKASAACFSQDKQVTKETHFIQVVTTLGNEGLPSGKRFRNLRDQSPRHVGIRLITNEGDLYSFGYEMPFPEEQTVTGPGMPRTFLQSANVFMSTRDYDEFRLMDKGARMVTTIPIAEEEKNAYLENVGRLIRNRPRFNYLGQNCAAYAGHVLRDVLKLPDIDFRSSIGEILLNTLPDASDVPLIGWMLGPIVRLATRILAYVPAIVVTVVTWAWSILTWIPRKMMTVARNLLFLYFGAGRTERELLSEQESQAEQQFPRQFRSLIENWTDVFRDEIGEFNCSGKVLDWQRKQESTAILPYDGIRFYVSPLSVAGLDV